MESSREFVPIQNADLEGDLELSFDLYLSLPLNKKVLLFRRKGEVLEGDRLVKLTQMAALGGATFSGEVASPIASGANLMVRRDDYPQFVSYVSDRLKRLLDVKPGGNNSGVLNKAVKGLLKGTFESEDAALVRSLMDNLNDVSTVVIDGVLSEISEHGRRTYRRLVNLAATGTDFQKHPVNVASLAVMIGLGSGYSTKRTIGDISMAALLHDLGLAKLPADLALKAHRKVGLSLSEIELLKNHVKHSIEVIEERNIQITPLSRTMIEQHHELYNGTGYPRHLRGLQVSPFAQILHIADEIDQHVFGASSTQVNAELRHLFEQWTFEKAIEPKLLARVRSLFFLN